jgi:hypothetical protein
MRSAASTKIFRVARDVDLSYRARLRGYRCRYAADAVVRHVGSATLGTVTPSRLPRTAELEWTYIKDTPGPCSGRHSLVISCRHRRRVHFSGSACCAHTCAPRLRRSQDCQARSASAPPFSGRGASRVRDRAAARHAWLAIKLREERFDTGWLEGCGERARKRGDSRQLQRRRGARAALRSIADDWRTTRGKASSSTTHRATGATRRWTRLREREARAQQRECRFARAVNQGLAATSAPCVLIMNPDCRVVAGATGTLRAILDAHPQCAIGDRGS